MIVSILITTVAISGIIALLYQPRFASSATLRIKTADRGSLTGADKDVDYTDRIANTLAKIGESPEFAEKVRANFGIAAAPRVRIAIVPRTELIEVSAEGLTSESARDNANFAANELVGESKSQASDSASSARTILQVTANAAAEEVRKSQLAYNALIVAKETDPVKLAFAQSQVEFAKNTYYDILKKTNDILLLETLRKNSVELQAPAELPKSPSQPNQTTILAIGALLGLLGGIATAFVAHRLDTKLYDESRVREVAGAPFIGSVPLIPTDEGRIQQMGSDAIHVVRTNVLALRERAPFKTLMIAGAMPGDGKTTVAIELAMSLARSGLRVVIVDADLRKPMIHRRMELQNDFGLGNLLSSAKPVTSSDSDAKFIGRAVRATFVNGLFAITSGSVLSHPAELVGSPRMQSIIDTLAVDYDLVIVDSPPVLVVPDATALAHRVERVALVAACDKSTEEELATTMERLANSGITPMGVIFNRVAWPETYYNYGTNEARNDYGASSSSKRNAFAKIKRMFARGTGGSAISRTKIKMKRYASTADDGE